VTVNCPDVQDFGVPATAVGDDKTGVDDATPAGAGDKTGSPAVDANADVTEGAEEVGTEDFAEPDGADEVLRGAAVHPATSATPTTNAGQPAIRTTPPPHHDTDVREPRAVASNPRATLPTLAHADRPARRRRQQTRTSRQMRMLWCAMCGTMSSMDPEVVMTDQAGLVLSVRGEATLTVPADSVLLSGGIALSRGSKSDALAEASAALQRLTTDLTSLGAVALTVNTEHDVLVWLARSATTWVERRHNKDTGINEPTGRVTANVSVQITVRDFDLLELLGAHLSTHQDLHLNQATWQVDSDNPGWAHVRAAAIHAAIDKGRDYAAALGVSLLEVFQVADAGLLEGGLHQVAAGHLLSATMGRGVGDGPADTPSLDPEPQELTAAIDARMRTTAVTLTQN